MDWPAIEIRFPRQRGDAVPLQELVPAVLDGSGTVAVQELADDAWLVMFREPGDRDRAARAVIDAFGDQGLTLATAAVPDEDWARRSQQDLHAIRVGRIVVTPPWDAPGDARGDPPVTIVIEPSTGFGTGHHASTRLCLAALQTLDLAGQSVIDVGTGSGVLALAAALLGSAPVVAIEVDPDAVDAARANIDRNGLRDRIDLRSGDIRDWSGAPADVVLGNLTGGMLIGSAAAMRGLCRRGGVLVLSGILREEERAVTDAFGADARVVWRETQDEWVGMVLAVSD